MSDFARFQASEGTNNATKEDTQAFDGVNGEEQLKDLEATVERLKVLSDERNDPFNDDVLEVPRLCRCLETILRIHQKEKLTFWSERKDYFHYLSEGTSKLKSLEQILKKIQENAELVTSQGKGRALIRLCLSQQVLADCIQSAVMNTKKTKDWYNPPSVLLNPAHTDRLVNSLYDLSTMEFKLPIVGVNLEEAWPSFVQKSFVSNSSSPSQRSKQGLFRSLKPQTKDSPLVATNVTGYQLEKAVEEQPSEVFVQQQIPFDIHVVSKLFSELQVILTDEFEGYTQESLLPEIKVTELDDITSGLSLLKDYITTMSEGMTNDTHKSHEVIGKLRQQLTEAERQLKRSLESESGCQLQLKSSLKMIDTLQQEKAQLRKENRKKEDELSSLQTLQQEAKKSEEHHKNEELLMATSTQLEEARAQVNNHALTLKQLQDDKDSLVTQNELIAEENNTLKTEKLTLKTEIEESHKKNEQEKEQYTNEIEKLVSEKKEGSAALAIELSNVKESHRKELSELADQAANFKRKCVESEEEKESLKDELRTVQGLVEQETASLRFQLSTNNMQLQQAIEARTNKEKELLELKQQLKEQVGELSLISLEKTRQQAEISELKQQLLISDTAYKSVQEDMTSLNNQLTENTLNRDVVREESLKIQRDCDDQKERMTTDFQKLNHQVSTLTEENDDLRKALQKLLEQKVNLWQHADELEQEQVSKGVWIDSRVVNECMDCMTVFNIFNRKHHCRSCGKVFCTQCCSNKVQLPSNRDKVRVCGVCYNRIHSLRTPHAASLVNTLEKDEKTESDNTSTSMSESINTFPGGVSLSDNNLLHLTPLNSSDESLLQHVKELVTTPRNHSRVSLDDSTEYSIGPLVSNTFAIPKSDGGSIDPDDEFCVIDVESNKPIAIDDATLDVQTLRAKLATLEASNNNDPSTTTVNGFNGSSASNSQDDAQEVDDLEVGGGQCHRVMVKVSTPRTVVQWQFSSQPRGIAMGLNYQESEDGDVKSILPEKRVMSHKTILVGEYVAQKGGIYTLVFSNAHSKYSGRLLSYKVWKKYQT